MISKIQYFLQRVFRGWDDRETWDLEFEFLRWIYPRLKRFKQISIAHPINFTEKEWDNFLEQLLLRTEKVIHNYDRLTELSLEEEEEVMKEKEKVVQIIADNFKNFGW